MVFGFGDKKKKADEVKMAVSGEKPGVKVSGIPSGVSDL